MQTLLSDTKRGCYVEIHRQILAPLAASRVFFEALGAPFESETYVMHGKNITTKRKTCAFGDPGVMYRYSGVARPALPWPEYLRALLPLIEEKVGRGAKYNYALSTQYIDGGAGLGWHSDNEPEIDQSVPICSLSLGAPRDFVMRDASTRVHALKVELGTGDLLVMRGRVQQFYQHAVPERGTRGNTRVSFTFRAIRPPVAAT